ncbi:unnamed protein product, partial [Scytosiphon promiscuus]
LILVVITFPPITRSQPQGVCAQRPYCCALRGVAQASAPTRRAGGAYALRETKDSSRKTKEKCGGGEDSTGAGGGGEGEGGGGAGWQPKKNLSSQRRFLRRRRWPSRR